MIGSTTITAKVNGKEYTCSVTVTHNNDYQNIEKQLAKDINAKRVEKGLKPLIYVSSGIMDEYVQLYYNDMVDEAYEIANANKFSSGNMGSMYLLGLEYLYNRNRILREHEEFYSNEYTHLAFYTRKGYSEDYNFIYFELITQF